MARSAIPDTLRMRELRAGLAPEAEREQVAQVLRSQGRNMQALLLYEGRAQHPALRGEVEKALASGQTFRLLSLRRLGVPVSDEQLRAGAEAAERTEHFLEARLAYQALGDIEAIRLLAAKLPASLVPPPPPPPPAPAATSSH